MSLSDPVKQFLRESISSVDQLEILLHLLPAGPAGHTVAEIAKTLYISETIAAERLTAFADKGLVARMPGDPVRYRIDPSDSNRIRLLEDVDRTYRERRVSLINFIYSSPSATIQSFADAFIIGKKNT